jgi:predicted Zn-dependent protease with MMP-like domain
MDREGFERLVAEAVELLPAAVRRQLDNVDIVLEEGESPNNSLFGLYHGLPKTRRGPYYAGVLPDKITIYKGTIEKYVAGPEALPKTVRRVVWHEIGHHLGFDESQIRKLERKWEKEGKV